METIRSGIWLNHRGCDCFLSAGDRQDSRGWDVGLYYSWKSRQHAHQHICFSSRCPWVLCGWCDTAQMSALYTVGLKCSWETLSLGNPLLLEQAVSKPASYPWGHTNPSLKVTTWINYPALEKEQTVMRKLSVEARLVANQLLVGIRKAVRKFISDVGNSMWHYAVTQQCTKLLPLITWKIGNATDKLLDLPKEIPRQNDVSVTLLVLDTYDKIPGRDEVKMQLLNLQAQFWEKHNASKMRLAVK